MEILLIGGVVTAFVFSAWLMTFAKWYPILGIESTFDFATKIRPYVDYCLMSVFNFSFSKD